MGKSNIIAVIWKAATRRARRTEICDSKVLVEITLIYWVLLTLMCSILLFGVQSSVYLRFSENTISKCSSFFRYGYFFKVPCNSPHKYYSKTYFVYTACGVQCYFGGDSVYMSQKCTLIQKQLVVEHACMGPLVSHICGTLDLLVSIVI